MKNNNLYKEIGKFCLDGIVDFFMCVSYFTITCAIWVGFLGTAALYAWFMYGYITYSAVLAVIWPMVVSLIFLKINFWISNNQDNKYYEILQQNIIEEEQRGYMA